MAKCRCDLFICSSCKSDHIAQCTVQVEVPTVEAVEHTTLKEKI